MIVRGDCLAVLAGLDGASVDAIVTDPPYGLGFMGKAWDALPPGLPWAQECLRVLKPGGHLLAFGGTRTYHRLACAIEDAGFEVRDTIAWLYGSGFPKSLNVGAGRGTALKPAHEPIIVARKALAGTVAQTVTAHGTGALNIDACRIATVDDLNGGAYSAGKTDDGQWGSMHAFTGRDYQAPTGRWPANVALDPEAAAMLDEQTGMSRSNVRRPTRRDDRGKSSETNMVVRRNDTAERGHSDSGGASRFFYVAKPSKRERNAGLDALPERNVHTTVKPIELMRWLIRLVTPPGGTVLDPFAGSGTTGCAAALEHVAFIGIEREPDYADLADARIAHWRAQAA